MSVSFRHTRDFPSELRLFLILPPFTPSLIRPLSISLSEAHSVSWEERTKQERWKKDKKARDLLGVIWESMFRDNLFDGKDFISLFELSSAIP